MVNSCLTWLSQIWHVRYSTWWWVYYDIIDSVDILLNGLDLCGLSTNGCVICGFSSMFILLALCEQTDVLFAWPRLSRVDSRMYILLTFCGLSRNTSRCVICLASPKPSGLPACILYWPYVECLGVETDVWFWSNCIFSLPYIDCIGVQTNVLFVWPRL